MKENVKNNKGITLISLVVTIIILIILAGVSLNLILGEYGIITIAKKAKENIELVQIEEQKQLNELYSELETNMEIDNKPNIIVLDSEVWSNTNKRVTISKKEGYITKYTLDGSEPNNNNGEIYKDELTIDKNCTIKAVYILNENVVGKIAQKEITKIDKLEPNEYTINIIPGKTTIDVAITSEVSDQEATKESGKSEIAGYRYNCRYNNEDHMSEIVNKKTYQFTEVYGSLVGVDCEIIVEVIDNAGNSKQIVGTTKTECLNENYIIRDANLRLGIAYNSVWNSSIYKLYSGNSIVYGWVGVWQEGSTGQVGSEGALVRINFRYI